MLLSFTFSLATRPQLRLRSSGSMSVMPAASIPGMARTRCRISWSDGPAPRPASAIVDFDLDGGHMRGLEAEIDVEQTQEAAQQQARADQQHTRQRHLGDHQRGSQALVAPALAHARTAVFQRLLQVAARNLECGSEAEDRADGDRNQHRPGERRAIHPDGGEQRQRDLVLMREIEGDRPREPQAEHRAGARERQALGQQLADQPAASGAQRRAHGKFLAPRTWRAPATGSTH